MSLSCLRAKWHCLEHLSSNLYFLVLNSSYLWQRPFGCVVPVSGRPDRFGDKLIGCVAPKACLPSEHNATQQAQERDVHMDPPTQTPVLAAV